MATRVPYPLKGLDENWGAADQPPLTTPLEVNMVVEDPTNGKTRGAQRCGSRKWCPEPIAAGKPVREVITVKGPKDNLTFTEPDPPETAWTKETDSGLEVHMVRGDTMENTYWLEQPNRITKRNRNGEVVWKLSVPANKPKQFCKVLEVDPFGTVWVAVTSSADPEDGRLWAYQVPIDEEEPEKLYTLKLPGFVRHMVWKKGALYVAVNRNAAYQAWVYKYIAADTVTPTLVDSWQVPYPCNALAVADDGSVFTASPPFENRAKNPESKDGTGKTAVDWTPYDLENAEERIWGWWDATDVAGVGGENETLADGDRVETWYSKVGSRVLRTAASGDASSALGGSLRKDGFAGQDTIYLSGGPNGVGSPGDGFQGHYGGSVQTPHDSKASAIPSSQVNGYADKESAWALFIVCRPDPAIEKKGTLFGGSLTRADSTSRQVSVFTNSTQSATGSKPTGAGALMGRIAHFDSGNTLFSNPGAGSAGQPLPGSYNVAPSGAIVLSVLFDAGMEASANNQQGYRSALRINGQPIDRWGSPSGAAGGSGSVHRIIGAGIQIGFDPFTDFGGIERYAGDVMEILVLRYNPSGTGTEIPVQGPAYPDTPYLGGGDSEIERVEGYLAWKWGLGQDLENQNGKGGGPDLTYIHPFGPGDLNAPPSPKGREATISQAPPEDQAKLLGPYAVLAKWSGGGSLMWAYSESNFGGVGSGLAISEDGVYSVGPPSPVASAVQYAGIRRFIDKGGYLGAGGTYYVFPDGSLTFPPRHVDIQSDAFFNLWIPCDDANHAVEPPLLFEKATFWGLKPTSAGGITVEKVIKLPGSPTPPGTSIWIPPEQPEYGDEAMEWPERVYVASRLEQTVELRIIPSVEGLSGFPSGVFFSIGDSQWTSRVTPTQANEFKSLPQLSQDEDQADIIAAVINGDKAFKKTKQIGVPTQPSQLVQAIDRYLDVGSGDQVVKIKALQPGAKALFLSGTNTAFAWSSPSNTFPFDAHETACSAWTIVDFDLDAPAPPREQVTLAVADGFVKKASQSGATPPSGPGSIDQSSVGALSPSGIPFAVVLFGKVYLTDGKRLLRYAVRNDVLDEFTPSKDGAPPKRIVLLEQWRTRMVAVTSDDRWNYYMSKVGDPDDWNFFPPILSTEQATYGDHPNNGAGKVPDIINGFVPITDDLALWGCDSTLFRQTGDPMKGGQIDQVHRASGMAFGRAWAIGPTGTVFYYGARGGIFALDPFGGSAERISYRRIERRTQDVDLALYRPRLEWDYERSGLKVSMVPYGNGGVPVEHWFWDSKNDRWSQFEYGNASNTTVQPTALAVVDGDSADDRRFILGCEDGYLRTFDRTAFDDDGVAIDSRVLIGPIVGPEQDLEARFGNIVAILGNRHSGCSAEIYVSDEWEDPGDPRVRKPLKAGRNSPILDAGRGPALWVGLRNASPGQRWSLESLYIDVQGVSEARERT